MTSSAKGSNESPGKNVAQKTGLNRSLAKAAPGETNAILKRAAQRYG